MNKHKKTYIQGVDEAEHRPPPRKKEPVILDGEEVICLPIRCQPKLRIPINTLIKRFAPDGTRQDVEVLDITPAVPDDQWKDKRWIEPLHFIVLERIESEAVVQLTNPFCGAFAVQCAKTGMIYDGDPSIPFPRYLTRFEPPLTEEGARILESYWARLYYKPGVEYAPLDS